MAVRILKFKSIKNVGRLVNCTGKGEQYKRFTLIFAENARGKTTLSAVLRSLKTNEPAYIIERQTVGRTGAPEAEIVLAGPPANSLAIFRNGAWNKSVPELEIFDPVFVAQNVHAGEHMDVDHHRRLLQIVIGAGGVTLAQRVTTLDEELRAQTTAVNDAKRALQIHAGRGGDVDQFVALTVDPDIEEKIERATAALEAAQNAHAIAGRSMPQELQLPALPATFAKLLSTTLADVSKDAEAQVRAQMHKHGMRDDGWLSAGLQLTTDDCPFCGQSVKGIALVKAYSDFFQDKYRDLSAAVSKMQSNIQATLGEAARERLRSQLARNAGDDEFWARYQRGRLDPLDFDQEVGAHLKRLHDDALSLIARKQSALLEQVPDASILEAIGNLEGAMRTVANYNASVRSVALQAARVKQANTTANVGALTWDLERLTRVKNRQTPEIAARCNTYAAAVAEKDRILADKVAAKGALDAHSATMFEQYQATINSLLRKFRAGFKLSLGPSYVGREPTSSVQFLIDDHPIDPGRPDTPLGTPCFRTAMSAGDKSTLALALFLAQIEHNPNKANCVLVFDDPFGSMDSARREHTAQLLVKFGHECDSLILLSHDAGFIGDVNSKLNAGEARILQLARIQNGKATDFAEWNLGAHMQTSYARNHATLVAYVHNVEPATLAILQAASLNIRLVLEGFIRRQDTTVPEGIWLGEMIGKIRNGEIAPGLADRLDELTSINDYSKRYHHETDGPVPNAGIPNDGELSGFVDMTLEIVGGS